MVSRECSTQGGNSIARCSIPEKTQNNNPKYHLLGHISDMNNLNIGYIDGNHECHTQIHLEISKLQMRIIEWAYVLSVK